MEVLRSNHWRCSMKKVVLKSFVNIHRKTPVLESLLNEVAGFQVEYCKIYKETYFEEHM